MDLLRNPFYLLASSPRDNRRRITELADERSLQLDSNECMQARSDLTNPRKRLSAEIGWLPGIGPKRTNEVLSLLGSSPLDLLDIDKLPPIARANLLSAGLSRLLGQSPDNVAEWIIEIATAFEEIIPEKLMGNINEDRVVSGFPEVTDISAVEAEIQERRRHYRNVFKATLDNLSPAELVKAVTVSVETATDIGEKHGPILIADLVDAYEVEAQSFLKIEEANITSLVEKIRVAVEAERSDSELAPMVRKLISIVKNWDIVAQPIQVSTKSHGLDHDASQQVAGIVRDLAIYMFNDHGKLDFTQQLTAMLQEVFAEVVDIAERTAEDANTLDNIEGQRKNSLLLNPIYELCNTAIENVKSNPTAAIKAAQELINVAPKYILDLASTNATSEILAEGKDEIALTLMHCAVAYGNKTDKWKPCISILEEALNYETSIGVKARIQRNYETVINNERLYGGLKPITSAPSLTTINGIGLTLYGSTNHDNVTNSHISTYYFVFFLFRYFQYVAIA